MAEDAKKAGGVAAKPKTKDPWDYYAGDGLTTKRFSVFPVKQDKKPALKVWKPYQTQFATEKEIAGWKKTAFGIAIATGKRSNLTVIDADNAEAIAELAQANPHNIRIPQVLTPAGGRHYYCQYSSELPANDANRGKSEKIDVRSEGGYVVAPPTYAKYEKGGKLYSGRYVWDKELNLNTTPIPKIPARWIYLLHPLTKSYTGPKDVGEKLTDGRRDNDLFRMACNFRREGYPREQVEEIIVEMGKQCTPPLSAPYSLRRVQSAFSRPMTDKWKRVEEVEIDPDIPMSFRMSEIEEAEMDWVWKNYVPSESITLLSGDPNAGKSWWALDFACKVSTGSVWADGTPGNAPANVYYMTYEDSLSKHIRKRIRTLGGDPTRITAYNSKHPLYLTLAEPEGIERLENELRRLEVVNGGLLVTDPILDFTGDSNPNAVEVVRAMLTPIVSMLERLHIACLMVGHLNKDQMKSAMYRAGGSTGGWMGKARAAFLVARDPDESAKRFVVPIKYNYAWPEPVQMEFEIQDGHLIFEITDVDINEILNPKPGRRPERREAAIAWLEEKFEDRDEIPSTEIGEMARRDGISMRTLQAVKAGAGYVSRRIFGPEAEVGVDRWMWKKQ